MTIRDYRDLVVWQRSLVLLRASYAVGRQLPPEERFELGSQIRRAANSVMANIVEGHGRPHRAEYRRFVGIAKGSVKELESHFYAAHAVSYLNDAQLAELLPLTGQVSRMLTVLHDRLAPRESSPPPPPPVPRPRLTEE